ncbi:MAG: hydroxyacid dehydrogenase [Patescibacteria group bacterium]
MTKIAFFEVQSWEKELIELCAKKLNADIYTSEVENDLKNVKNYEIISTFIYSDLSSKILKQLPRLKMIASRSTGMDHIDLDYCKSKKITVANVPHYGENTIAEHAFGLILALSHRLIESVNRVRQGSFSQSGLAGFDLMGKTLGVVGVGSIGQHVVKIANGFGMKVLGVANHPDPKLAKKLGFEYVNLEECLKRSDIVSLHTPLVKDTFHLINRQNISLMKPGAVLINTSRGPVVESEAILWAIENKTLSGAGLDVLEEEESLDKSQRLFDPYLSKDDLKELVAAHLLREKPNVIITPHNAFNTKEAVGRIIDTTVDNIERFLASCH